MTPTADDVATAICAAARETGDNPYAVAQGGLAAKRARHYALHALVYVFPKCSKDKIAFYVGAAKSGSFYANSIQSVLGQKSFPKASWWDEALLDRVITAIEADRTRRAIRANPIKLSANVGGYVSSEAPAPASDKRALQAMLAEAARNTAKLQPKG